MDETQEVIFEFSIRSITDKSGKKSLHPTVVNQGVPDEYILAMMRTMIRHLEQIYFEKFKQKF